MGRGVTFPGGEERTAVKCFLCRRCCEAAVPGVGSSWEWAVLGLSGWGELCKLPVGQTSQSAGTWPATSPGCSLFLSADTHSASFAGRGKWTQGRCRHSFSGLSASGFPDPELWCFRRTMHNLIALLTQPSSAPFLLHLSEITQVLKIGSRYCIWTNSNLSLLIHNEECLLRFLVRFCCSGVDKLAINCSHVRVCGRNALQNSLWIPMPVGLGAVATASSGMDSSRGEGDVGGKGDVFSSAIAGETSTR